MQVNLPKNIDPMGRCLGGSFVNEGEVMVKPHEKPPVLGGSSQLLSS